MTDTNLSPAWLDLTAAIERRANSPVLLPLAIGALCALYENGQQEDGRIAFVDFEAAMRKLAAEHRVQLKSGPWMPYLALAGPLGALHCLDDSTGAPISWKGAKRPKGRKALLEVSHVAALQASLSEGLFDPSRRTSVQAWTLSRVHAGAQRPAGPANG
ncbi:hypothetical protein N9226_00635 [bacterium]|nr:hypothetical protein [bacterium]